MCEVEQLGVTLLICNDVGQSLYKKQYSWCVKWVLEREWYIQHKTGVYCVELQKVVRVFVVCR